MVKQLEKVLLCSAEINIVINMNYYLLSIQFKRMEIWEQDFSSS